MEKEYNDLIGEILERSGEKDKFNGKGKGKPIPDEYFKMDTFQKFQQIARDAGFLPPWLKFQKEISALIHSCKTEQDISAINEKIKKYNKICPFQLQKSFVSLDGIEKAKMLW